MSPLLLLLLASSAVVPSPFAIASTSQSKFLQSLTVSSPRSKSIEGRMTLRRTKKKRWATLSAYIGPHRTAARARANSVEQSPRTQARRQAAGCGIVPCPDVSTCQPVNGAPSCSCPMDQYSRLVNNKCSTAPMKHWGYLDPHNNARAAVGSGPLIWDNQLATFAQNWANFLASGSNNCKLQLGGMPNGVGQNVANFFQDPLYTNVNGTLLWVQQGGRYRNSVFDVNSGAGCATGNWKDCAAYTQVVWNSTRRLGCGVGMCPTSVGKVWVCNYWPAGNIVGQFPYNNPGGPVPTPPTKFSPPTVVPRSPSPPGFPRGYH